LKEGTIKEIEKVLKEAYINSNTVYIMWNWWSASTASHWACDFNKWTVCKDKNRFKFVSLNDNISHLTAIANDISYDDIFSEQLKNRLTKNDIVIVISASWNSKNIIKALEYSNSIWSKSISLVWFKWWEAKKLANICLHVNNMEYWHVEDIHMIFNHLLSTYFKKNIIKWINK